VPVPVTFSRIKALRWDTPTKYSINIPVRILLGLQNQADLKEEHVYALMEAAMIRGIRRNGAFPEWSRLQLQREMRVGKKETSMKIRPKVWTYARMVARGMGLSLEIFVGLSLLTYALATKTPLGPRKEKLGSRRRNSRGSK
jgi:hypothetical protein